MSWPLNLTSPSVAASRRRIVRPNVVLPQPDSPTSPSVSPRRIWTLTPSTAWTWPIVRRRKPPRIGKYFLRFVTSTRTSSPDVARRPSSRDGVASAATCPPPGRSTDDIGDGLRCFCRERASPLRFLGRLQPAARCAIRVADLDQARFGLAAVPGVRAARLEFAAGRHAERIGHDALDRGQLAPALLLGRNRVEQALRVRMLRRQEDFVGRAGLDD